VDVSLVDSWLLVISHMLLLRSHPRRCILRLKLWRIQKKCSRNLRLKKTLKKCSRRRIQLSSHSYMEANADGDIVIPPTPEAAEDAPLRQLPLHPMLWVEILMIQGMTMERMMKTTTMVMKILRRKMMMIFAIMGLSTTSTPLKMRVASSVFYCRRYCSTWVHHEAPLCHQAF
jgi:hypothetical protein